MSQATTVSTLDVRGLNCPLPLLKTKKALLSLPVGGLLTVLTTDTDSVPDLRAFAQSAGYAVAVTGPEEGVYRVAIARTEGPA